MFRRLATYLSAFGLSVVVLFATIFPYTRINYSFAQSPSPAPGESLAPYKIEIDYQLPFAGRVHPDNVLWSAKVIRDKVWIAVNIKPEAKAQVLLLQADKRLGSASLLMDRDKPELSISTLTKAEKYLEDAFKYEEIARKSGVDTSEFLEGFVYSTLKHRQVIKELFAKAPEDAKGHIDKTEAYPKRLFVESQTVLRETGKTPPENPFDN